MYIKKAVESDKYISKVKVLLDILKLDSDNYSNFVLAFIHRSLVNEKPDLAPEHNERLEFLWDAVLELVITSSLYLDFPDKPEWDLTDIRSSLVRWKNLAKVARDLDFQTYLLLWKWEELSGGRDNDYLLANCLEAFIWAIYLESWYDKARDFIIEFIYSNLDNILKNNLYKDYKSLIQEYVQAEFSITPNYEVISEDGPDHEKEFICWVYMWEKLLWKWLWRSKKKAQESAAEDAYKKLNIE